MPRPQEWLVLPADGSCGEAANLGRSSCGELVTRPLAPCKGLFPRGAPSRGPVTAPGPIIFPTFFLCLFYSLLTPSPEPSICWPPGQGSQDTMWPVVLPELCPPSLRPLPATVGCPHSQFIMSVLGRTLRRHIYRTFRGSFWCNICRSFSHSSHLHGVPTWDQLVQAVQTEIN